MVAFAVGPRAAVAGHRVVVHDRLDSTNSEALRLARAGDSGPLWIVAIEQTLGRGRRGREWLSAPGNLAASLLFSARVTPAVAATLGFVASLAVGDACRALAPDVAIGLKWPNDVLADGRKVAGLLLESEAQAGGLGVVVGFGINLAAAPERMAFPAVSLAALGQSVAPDRAFGALTDAWIGHAGTWDNGHGFGEIRRRWLDQAQGIGQVISVRTGDRVDNGIFETLDAQGRLVLRTPDGAVRTISAGDVHFGDAGSAGPFS